MWESKRDISDKCYHNPYNKHLFIIVTVAVGKEGHGTTGQISLLSHSNPGRILSR